MDFDRRFSSLSGEYRDRLAVDESDLVTEAHKLPSEISQHDGPIQPPKPLVRLGDLIAFNASTRGRAA
jgi:hypothetical protein